MPKVLAFLDALALSGCVAEAARSVGMGRQSAYRLRARLADTRLAPAFENARRMGIRARGEALRARNRSRWEGEMLGDFLARNRPRQGDTRPSQGDAGPAQGDGPAPQGDTLGPRGRKIPWTV